MLKTFKARVSDAFFCNRWTYQAVTVPRSNNKTLTATSGAVIRTNRPCFITRVA